MSAGPTTIERLDPARIDRMRSALRVFAEAFDEHDTYFSNPASDAYLEQLLADPKFVMLTARCDGEVVGALSAYELMKYEKERSELYIFDLAVAEPFRRGGIATALIQALKPIARAKAAWMIFVQADREDAPAVALYRKLGIEEQPLHFDISPA